jgi:hypothetical protein
MKYQEAIGGVEEGAFSRLWLSSGDESRSALLSGGKRGQKRWILLSEFWPPDGIAQTRIGGSRSMNTPKRDRRHAPD